MRWNNLFDDLEGQFSAGVGAGDTDQRIEEERLRLAKMDLRDRLLSLSAGEREVRGAIRLALTDGTVASIRPLAFGSDWLSGDLVDGSDRRSQCVLPLASISAVLLDRDEVHRSLLAVEADSRKSAGRIPLTFVLRDLCRRRRELDLMLHSGAMHGTIDRVGADHFDLAVHEAGTPRREAAVSQYRVVPIVQLLLVRL